MTPDASGRPAARPIRRLLIANRGEIAIRVARTAAELGIETVAVHSRDDAGALHPRKADAAHALDGDGPAAYLDVAAMVAAARETGCDALHPGYGFLSEREDFAQACLDAGLVFVGPAPRTLALFGDKAAARAHAIRCGVPTLTGTDRATTLDEAREFLARLGPGGAIMLKAIGGGGGRGMRPVTDVAALDEAWARCASEAATAFGSDALYVERLLPRARHVEVQVAGDGASAVHLWERECSLQRQRQKLVEIAPAPGLAPGIRDRLLASALRIAREANLANLATIEFLVDADGASRNDGEFAFVEANARLQVEHTVTEELLGLDLVRLQLQLAAGATLAQLGLARSPALVAGCALQARINLETMNGDGTARPSAGTIAAYELPSGRGLRVDGCGYAGWRTGLRFDSLLAKLVVRVDAGGLPQAAAKAQRALAECRIEGVATNVPFLQALLAHPDVRAGRLHTRFVDERIGELLAQVPTAAKRRWVDAPAGDERADDDRRAGARRVGDDPLGVLNLGREAPPARTDVPAGTSAAGGGGADGPDGPDGTHATRAPLQGTVLSVAVAEGARVRRGETLLVVESMKMEHVVEAAHGGVVRRLAVAAGDTVFEGDGLAWIEPAGDDAATEARAQAVETDAIRADLAEVLERQRLARDDAARPEAVAKRHAQGRRTARENLAELVDPGSFVEYGSLVVAARRQRASMDELIARTPADGLVMGIGRINGELFPDERARAIAMSYDYTVLAGTQGYKNHEKKDRMFELAEKLRLPVVLFAEGGGGRPGDTDRVVAGTLNTRAFELFGRLSGLVPLVAVVSGRCFAGNAVLAGCCDVIVATRDANLGMGGPAMIEGGGLGVYRPEEVGPMDVQQANGVVDVLVDDDAQAVAVARKYLSYFQGAIADWRCADQRVLRRLVPESRVRAYDVRAVVDALADAGSVLELRPQFGRGMITALVRIEGRPAALIANNPLHLGGAIDSDGADKAARFMQLADAFDLPIVTLCDTPGNMVGPEAEKAALVRHCCRLYVTAQSVDVPLVTVVLRKGYGLGAQGMAGGSFWAPDAIVSWPTGEFGGMGLEGAVKLAWRNELAAIEDPAERRAEYERRVAQMYEQGKALSTASLYEIDDVIDPADTRRVIVEVLRAAPPRPPRTGKKRPCIDTW